MKHFLDLDDPRIKSEAGVPEHNNQRPHFSCTISLLRACATAPTVTSGRVRNPGQLQLIATCSIRAARRDSERRRMKLRWQVTM